MHFQRDSAQHFITQYVHQSKRGNSADNFKIMSQIVAKLQVYNLQCRYSHAPLYTWNTQACMHASPETTCFCAIIYHCYRVILYILSLIPKTYQRVGRLSIQGWRRRAINIILKSKSHETQPRTRFKLKKLLSVHLPVVLQPAKPTSFPKSFVEESYTQKCVVAKVPFSSHHDFVQQ